jgi:CHAD domain-containing protein
MKKTTEREIKLQASAHFTLPRELGEPIEPRRFSSTYHDTSDHRLAASGVTLRYRAERGCGAWQLKLPRAGDRIELELPGNPDEVPSRFGELLVATTRGRPLAPVATLDTHRRGLVVSRRGRQLAEVLVDEVEVFGEGAAVSRLDELEVELVGGDDRSLQRIERALRAAGALDADERPKLFRALGLVRPSRRPPKRSAPPMRHLVAMLQDQYRAILVHDPGTRLGEDAEELHQMRVAVRRLRALLRAARPMLDREWVNDLRSELAWAGGSLGEVRDLDVLLDHLRADAAALGAAERAAFEPLTAELERRREKARKAMLRDLSSQRYIRLLDRLESELDAPPQDGDGLTLAQIARREHRRLRRAVNALGDAPPDEELHEVRKQVKRARYAAELAERSRGRPASRYISAAKEMQDLLGDHQDAHVAEGVIRELAEGASGTAALAAGMLVEHQRERRRDARRALPGTWERLRKSGKNAWV